MLLELHQGWAHIDLNNWSFHWMLETSRLLKT